MALDPQAAAFYGEKRFDVLPRSVEEARAHADAAFNDRTPLLPIHKWEERTIPGPGGPLPVRIYTPFEHKTPLPVLLYFHGGGFVLHNPASHDSLCRKLSTECRSIVVSVGYRLAPEHRYPAAIEDGYAALCWAAREAPSFGGDPDRLLTAGDSAGATISAALSLMTRDRKGPRLSAQLLFYGVFGAVPADASQSMADFGGGDYVLPRLVQDWFTEQYRPHAVLTDTGYFLPGTARDLRNLPTTLVVSGEFDPLRDDDEEFARRLTAAGNSVTSFRADGMMHGFLLHWHRFDRAAAVLTEAGRWVCQRFC